MLSEATVFTNSLMVLSLEYELDALNLLTAPSAALNCATHIGTKIDIRPQRSAFALMALAVSPVIQSPHRKPIAIVATAPKAMPSRKRLRASPCKIAGTTLMMVSLVCAHANAFAASQTRHASTTGGNYLISEIARSEER